MARTRQTNKHLPWLLVSLPSMIVQNIEYSGLLLLCIYIYLCVYVCVFGYIVYMYLFGLHYSMYVIMHFNVCASMCVCERERAKYNISVHFMYSMVLSLYVMCFIHMKCFYSISTRTGLFTYSIDRYVYISRGAK